MLLALGAGSETQGSRTVFSCPDYTERSGELPFPVKNYTERSRELPFPVKNYTERSGELLFSCQELNRKI